MNDDYRSKQQAETQLASIVAMMTALKYAREHRRVPWEGDRLSADDIQEIIDQDPLCVEVRSDWHVPGGDDSGPTEYSILLCTGGPAVRIRGDLDEHRQPTTAVVEHQDWGTPWTPLLGISDDDQVALLEYAACFYYGE